jgi:metallophosphoesterase superfamily enzyme
MKCNLCGLGAMVKNGTRNGKQRYRCTSCSHEQTQKNNENILVIPDLHIPFEHPKALKFVSDIKKEYDCKKIIQIGDLTDQYCFSRYVHDPDSMKTRDEIKISKKKIRSWVKEFPELIITTGNHCVRIQKRIREIGIPPDVVLHTINDIFDMPKTWIWIPEYTYQNITYLHGCKTGEYAHINTAKDYRHSVVIGHTHATLGVSWATGINDKIFGANCGCLIDPNTYAFYYAREMTRRPTLGCIVMLNGKIPLPIPME